MQTKRLLLIVTSLIVLLLLAGTVGATPTDDGERSITVIDDSGKTVLIQGEPQRIVSLAPSNTEILYALGLEDRIVAVTERCDYPPATADKPKVGGFSTVNIEKVIAMEPDLIFAAPANTDEVIDRLRSLGMTVVTLDPQTIDGVLHDIELAGRATGQEEQASVLIRELQQRIRAVTENPAESPADHPSVAHVIWYDPLWVSGRGTIQNEENTQAGGLNAVGSIEEWGIVSLEEFIVTDPDYILVSSGTGMSKEGYDVIYDYFMNEPRMQNLKAVKNGHVYVVDADTVSRGGPRIVDALEEVARDLRPDLFDEPAPKAIPATQAPGFGLIPLVCALFIVLRLRAKR